MLRPAPQSYARSRKYLRGTIACRKCGKRHHVYKVDAIAADFSTRCPACHQRGFYAKDELAIEQLPDRRRTPRKE